MGLLARYTKWLHTQWPAGKVEKLPLVKEDGTTNVPGLSIVGDLTGIPLLKFSADTGARAVQRFVDESSFARERSSDNREDGPLDLVIIGGGVSGMAAALEAKKHDLRFEILEASEPFSTIVNFPRGKPIYTYPTEMKPAGDMHFKAEVKEPLLDELRAQTLEQGITPRQARAVRVTRKSGALEVELAEGEPIRARRVIVGIGRSGNFRKLGVPGEDLDKVYNRLHDPQDFCGQEILVVGGGDSAMESAIALARCGSKVTLSYRKPEFSRPKPENVEQIMALAEDPNADVGVEEPSSERVTTAAGAFIEGERGRGSVTLLMNTQVKAIRDNEVVITHNDGGKEQTLANDAVFSMIGREPPLDFFRRSGVRIRGEWTAGAIAAMTGFILFCMWLYHWKGGKPIADLFYLPGFLNPQPGGLGLEDRSTLLGTLSHSMAAPDFYYSLAYSIVVVIFGVQRIRRRRTPYITWQTTSLMAIQVIPLFLLPQIILPWMHANGLFDAGIGKTVADGLFPAYGEEREFWRAYGLILAWPLFAYNWFTNDPLVWWLIIGVLQTFVIIPLIIWRWGKGAYCGWICSCGALAETLGDTHRHKMPHGPGWNRLNMLGQGILLFALLLMVLRILSWIWPESWAAAIYAYGLERVPVLNYKYMVDLMLAGVLGYGLYFWFSGRTWCRFACPLAALMHIYARFSRFRIFSEKKKCISCNVCTSVCHQGIDVMNFANKGLGMKDPECVRCSACVQSCPTGTLYFGRLTHEGREIPDRLAASPVRMREGA